MIGNRSRLIRLGLSFCRCLLLLRRAWSVAFCVEAGEGLSELVEAAAHDGDVVRAGKVEG